MTTNGTLSEFVRTRMSALGITNKTLAEKGGLSFRIISDILQGRLDAAPLDKSQLSNRKFKGLSESIFRLLRAIEEDPRPWMHRLGLNVQHAEVAIQQSFENRLALAKSRSLTLEDLEQFLRVQKELGELFTLEMMIHIFLKKNNL